VQVRTGPTNEPPSPSCVNATVRPAGYGRPASSSTWNVSRFVSWKSEEMTPWTRASCVFKFTCPTRGMSTITVAVAPLASVMSTEARPPAAADRSPTRTSPAASVLPTVGVSVPAPVSAKVRPRPAAGLPPTVTRPTTTAAACPSAGMRADEVSPSTTTAPPGVPPSVTPPSVAPPSVAPPSVVPASGVPPLPGKVKTTADDPNALAESTAITDAGPAHAGSERASQVCRTASTGAEAKLMLLWPLSNTPRVALTRTAPLAAPSTCTTTTLEPSAAAEAGDTLTCSEPEAAGGPSFAGEQASAASRTAGQRRRSACMRRTSGER
jgi:hypothetical protein